jgi:hypothetical protein
LESNTGTEIALNVTRTRVTVLVFNLTIISLMLSMIFANGGTGEHQGTAHLTSSVALFVGFCLTLVGIFLLLFSQNLDAQGLSRPWSFTLGAMTTYLSLSQTVTAFMHEYLLRLKSVLTVGPEKRVDPRNYCVQPIITNDPRATLEQTLSNAKLPDEDSPEGGVILRWGKEERIVAHADLLRRLCEGVFSSPPNPERGSSER